MPATNADTASSRSRSSPATTAWKVANCSSAQPLGGAHAHAERRPSHREDVLRPEGRRVAPKGIANERGGDRLELIVRSRGDELRPRRARIGVTIRDARVGNQARRLQSGNRVGDELTGDQAAVTTRVPMRHPVDRPAARCPPQPRKEAELVARCAEAQRRRCSVLLRRELHDVSLLEALPEKASIEIGLLIARGHVGTRRRRGQVTRQLFRYTRISPPTLDGGLLVDQRSIWLRSSTRPLRRWSSSLADTVNEYANAAARRRDSALTAGAGEPAGAHQGVAQHPVEQILHGEAPVANNAARFQRIGPSGRCRRQSRRASDRRLMESAFSDRVVLEKRVALARTDAVETAEAIRAGGDRRGIATHADGRVLCRGRTHKNGPGHEAEADHAGAHATSERSA